MALEASKRKGRFWKKGSKVLDIVKVQNYAFEEVSEQKMTSHDNVKANIIHHKLHDDEYLTESVNKPKNFFESVVDPKQLRPVMKLKDFTSDWQRERQRQKRRSHHWVDDDEDYDFEVEEMIRKQEKNEKENINSGDETEDDDEDSREENVSAAEPKATGQDNDDQIEQNVAQNEILDQLQSPTVSFEGPDDLQKMSQALADEAPTYDKSADEVSKISENETPPSAVEATEQNIGPTLDENVENEMREKVIYEDAYKKGLEDGLRNSKEKFEKLFSNVDQLNSEFSSLKKKILESAQENFYEISKAITESLVQKEIELNPESFATIVQNMIQRSISDESFKVYLNPEDFKNIEDIGNQFLDGKVFSREDVEKGAFKVESESGEFLGNLKEIIDETMKEADLELFQDPSNEGTKAG